jgi:alkanesulfonate monooxygenase SsuD/methylene tetrahydromethanopterin reductase-like flavin-dependent oxidoreductase (luciferase family)
MRIGIHMPLLDFEGNVLDANGVMQRARAIEAAGFDGIWMGDGLSGITRPDVLMWLLVAAAGTERIEVGTSVLQVPLREPVELAQRFLTLHALTRGRFSVGVGTGSGINGYAAQGRPEAFDHRFKLLRESLKTIKALCNGEKVGAADLKPWPSTIGGPPIIIGSWSSERWMQRAATEYDGWMCSGSFNRSKGKGDETTLNTLAENIKRFRDMGGKRALISSVLVDLTEPEAPTDRDAPFNLFCGPKSAAERLAVIADMGYDDVLLVKRDSVRRRSLYEADLSEEDLIALRGLVERERVSSPA